MTETDAGGESESGGTANQEPDSEPDAADEDGELTDPTGDESAADDSTLGVGVVTIANDRSLDSDATGEAIVTSLTDADHEVVTREHIGSDHDRVQSIVSRMLDRDDVDVIVTGGATSVEPTDVTIEAVEPLLDKHLTAFDELFTSMAREVVGTRVLAARTIAGVTEGTPVFCLPGNEDAARLAVGEIILPELHHLVALAREEIPQDKWAVDESEVPDQDGETPEESRGGGEAAGDDELASGPEADTDEPGTVPPGDETGGGA